MRILFVFCLQSLLLAFPGQAQPELDARIDSLFRTWNRPNHPGGVVGVMRGGEIAYLRAYGLASLEYLVPNQTETLFNIASVSKQFTAMGIVRLHEAGALSIDDDIRAYIPELPDFGHTITIRHLMHHTSGLRSLHALLEMAGWRDDDARTNDDLYRYMARQQDLNFPPGEAYLYCNTGYMYMVRIIEEVTGEPFVDWMEEQIFQPLGLRSTYVEDRYDRVVPHNATSYYGRAEEGFDRAIEYWGYVGSGNMHTNVRDLLRWLSNFYDPAPGWASSFELLQTLDPFNNGEPNRYAFGVQIGDYRGLRRIGHGGSIGGFRSNVVVFPDRELGIAVLTNFSSADPGGQVAAITEILLGPEQKPDEAPPIEAVDLSAEALLAFEGSFWNAKEQYVRKIELRQDTLRYVRGENNASALLPVSDDTFRMLGLGEDVLLVRFGGSGEGRRMMVSLSGGRPDTLAFFQPTEATEAELASYAGRYYSPELQTTYTLSYDGETLTAYHPRHGSRKTRRIRKDVLDAGWPLGVVKIQRSAEGQVEGLYATNGRVRRLWMEKTK